MPGSIVMKFGGTSLRDAESRSAALDHVQRNLAEGHGVAVVVSAMGRKGEPYATDTLIGLLVGTGEPVAARELVSSKHQQSGTKASAAPSTATHDHHLPRRRQDQRPPANMQRAASMAGNTHAARTAGFPRGNPGRW